MTGVSAARKVAFQVLMAVERGPSHSDDLLRGKAVESLSAADRNLATALVLGVLRWQIRLDHELKSLLKHPNARLDPEVRVALRLGAFQLLHMDRIPARAAIDESVELAKQTGHRFASGMVNAVLRKLAAKENVEPSADSSEQIALASGHPEWMVERWEKFFGREAAAGICRHGQEQATATVRLVSPEAEAELTQAGVVLAPGELLAAARVAVSGDGPATAAFREGRVRLQDEGSQLAAEIAGAESANQAGRNRAGAILDCCAAPGGKTMILAERNSEARIVACEASQPRLAQLRKRLAAYGPRIECRLADATALTDEAAFDVALVDVPCSGTGTLGRNPEIRHRLLLDDLPRQAERQRAILRVALRAVKPGGRVVYSTCSLEPEEDEQVVAAVLAETANARQTSLIERIAELRKCGVLMAEGAERLIAAVTPEGALRLLPGAFQSDGFFIATLERTA